MSAYSSSQLPVHTCYNRSGSGTLTTRLPQCSTGRHSSLPGTPFAVGAQRGGTTHLPSATVRPHLWCFGDAALAARPGMRAVPNRSVNFQSASRQRTTISATSCRRRWPTWSASSAVSNYQPPSRAALQAVYCWQLCFSGCRSSSLEWSVRGRCLIVIIADFSPSIKNSSCSTFNFHTLTWFLTVWLASLHRSL